MKLRFFPVTRFTGRLGRYPFTYIEATFAILIITILTVMLLPALQRAAISTHRSSCEYNLQAIGLALKSYADDYDQYPIGSPMLEKLKISGYLKNTSTLYCPLDKSETRDTYSAGYMGGHPSTIDYADPLVVCGWHPQIGTLAVFPDGQVMPQSQRGGGSNEDVVPLTISYNGEDAGPGFVLHQLEALVIETEDGNEALVYGSDGTYFISASYDPFGDNGNGEFTLAIGYDIENAQVGVNQKSQVESQKSVVIQSTLYYSKVEVVGDPANQPTEVKWKPNSAPVDSTNTDVVIKKYKSYDITHLQTGELDGSNTPDNSAVYEPDSAALNKKK